MSAVYPKPQDIRTRPRRNNAPVRPHRRPATAIPDLLIAFSAVAWTMAVVLVAASLGGNEITTGDAGRFLARIFAGALGLSGLLLLLLALSLLRDERGYGDHYRVPIGVGIAVGLMESALFLQPAGPWVFAPLVLLLFALRPLRRLLARSFGTSSARR